MACLKTRASKRFLLMFAGFTLCLLLAYLLLFNYQLGARVKAGWWVKNVYSYKAFVAENTPSPKILIVAGSNGLFGIDSAIIEQRTGMPVVNMAVHGALSMQYLYFNIKDYAREGDVVVLPLEGTTYFRGYSDWFVNNMLAWGQDDYLGRVALGELLEFIVHVPPMRILEGAAKQTGENPVLPREKVLAQMQTVLEGDRTRHLRGYGLRTLNRYGDQLIDHAPTSKLMKQYRNGIGKYQRHFAIAEFSESFSYPFEQLVSLSRQRGFTVLVTWPVSIRNKKFDLSLPEFEQWVERFRQNAVKQGVKIYCHPVLFNLDIRYFFNTLYHPNRYGAMIRSENLGECLNTVLRTGADDGMSFPQALETVRAQEALYGDAAAGLSVE